MLVSYARTGLSGEWKPPLIAGSRVVGQTSTKWYLAEVWMKAHTATLCHRLCGSHQVAIRAEFAPQYVGAITLNCWQTPSFGVVAILVVSQARTAGVAQPLGRRLLPI